MHKLERDILFFRIRSELFALEILRFPWRNPMFCSQPLSTVDYITRDYKPIEERAQAVIAAAGGIGKFLRDAQTNLDTAIPRTWLETALLQVNGNIEFIQNDVKQAMGTLEDPVLAKELEAALGKMIKALEEHWAFLEAHKAHATNAYALGAKTFVRLQSFPVYHASLFPCYTFFWIPPSIIHTACCRNQLGLSPPFSLTFPVQGVMTGAKSTLYRGVP